MMIKQHKHSGLGGDGEKVSWNNIKNKISLQKSFAAYRLKTSGQGAGDITITTGFKPKYVSIYSIYPIRFAKSSSVTIEQDDGSLITTTDYNTDGFLDIIGLGTGNSNTVPCVNIVRDATRSQILFMKSFNTDGFTLRYGQNGTNNVEMHILAIG